MLSNSFPENYSRAGHGEIINEEKQYVCINIPGTRNKKRYEGTYNSTAFTTLFFLQIFLRKRLLNRMLLQSHYWNKWVTFDCITAKMLKNRVIPLRVHQKLQHPTAPSPNVSICYLRVWQISINYPVCHLQRIFALLQHSHCVKYARIWFFTDRIVQYKNRIYDSVLIQENAGQWKTVSSHILHTESFKLC